MSFVTETGNRRLAMLADGMPLRAIADREGITLGAVKESIDRAIDSRAVFATPGSQLPAGWMWVDRGDPGSRRRNPRYPRWYVSGRALTQDAAKWALALPDGPATCGMCGRPL